MKSLLPPLPGLRPHEQALAEKWEREKRERIERELAAKAELERELAAEAGSKRKLEPVLLKQSTAFAKVYGDAISLYANNTNWGMKPPQTIQCETCKGNGLLYPRLSQQNWNHRRAEPCPDCYEEQQKRNRQALRYDLIKAYPEKKWLLDLGALAIDFDYLKELELKPEQVATAKKILNKAYLATKSFATTCEVGQLLTMEGSYGTAKTHLAAKIYRYAWLKHKLAVIYTSGQQFQSWVTDFSKNQYGRTSAETKKTDLILCDLLIIDESDRISVSDKAKRQGDSWTENAMLEILDARIQRKLSTVLIGNHISARLSGAIQSRIHAFGAHFIDMSGVPDGRAYFGND